VGDYFLSYICKVKIRTMKNANLRTEEGWIEVDIISIAPQGSKYIVIYEISSSINPQRFETYNLTDIEFI